jgi:hypothetical protein
MEYDLDFSEDYVLPLSADRKNVLPSDEARETARRIAIEIARALLLTIGKKQAKKNAAVLRAIFELSKFNRLVSLFDEFIKGDA